MFDRSITESCALADVSNVYVEISKVRTITHATSMLSRQILAAAFLQSCSMTVCLQVIKRVMLLHTAAPDERISIVIDTNSFHCQQFC